jgi:hypothetical protein
MPSEFRPSRGPGLPNDSPTPAPKKPAAKAPAAKNPVSKAPPPKAPPPQWWDRPIVLRRLLAGAAVAIVTLTVAVIVLAATGDESGGRQAAATPTPGYSPYDFPTTTVNPASQGVVGQPQVTSLGVKATPITFENPTARQPDFVSHEGPRPWALLDAELCAGPRSTLTKTGYGFSLIDAENREYREYDSSPQPFKPQIDGGDLAPGECARGYVNFALPEGVRIVAIRWDYPGGGGPLRWALQ